MAPDPLRKKRQSDFRTTDGIVASLKWGAFFAFFCVLNSAIFLYADLLSIDPHTRRVMLYRLLPPYWPDWFSFFLWVSALGFLLASLLRLDYAQKRLEVQLTALTNSMRGAMYLSQWVAALEKWPLERWIINGIRQCGRQFKTFLHPRYLPPAIRILTIITSAWVFLSHVYSGGLSVGSASEFIALILSFPSSTVRQLYYHPLCDLFCYGTFPLGPFFMTAVAFAVLLLIYRESKRLVRSRGRAKKTQIILHYIFVGSVLLLTVFVLTNVRAISAGTIDLFSMMTILRPVPRLCYYALCHFFAHGTVSWALLFTVLFFAGLLSVGLSTSRILLRSCQKDTVPNKIVRRNIIVGTTLIIALFACYRAMVIVRFQGDSFIGSVILFLPRLPRSAYDLLFFHPLCNFFCYGSVSITSVVGFFIVCLFLWGLFRVGQTIATADIPKASEFLPVRSLQAGVFIFVAVIFLGNVVTIKDLFAATVNTVFAAATTWPKWSYANLYYHPLCDWFSYGYTPWPLLLVSTVIGLVVWGIRQLGIRTARSPYCDLITRKFLRFLLVGTGLMISAMLIGNILLVQTFFATTVGFFVVIPDSLYKHTFFLPLCDLFCYGDFSWKLPLFVLSVIGSAALLLYMGKRWSKASWNVPGTDAGIRTFSMMLCAISVAAVAAYRSFVFGIAHQWYVDYYHTPLFGFIASRDYSWNTFLPLFWLVVIVALSIYRMARRFIDSWHRNQSAIFVPRGLQSITLCLLVCLSTWAVLMLVSVICRNTATIRMIPNDMVSLLKRLYENIVLVPLYNLFSYGIASWTIFIIATFAILFCRGVYRVTLRISRSSDKKRIERAISESFLFFGIISAILFVFACREIVYNIMASTFLFLNSFCVYYYVLLCNLFCYGNFSCGLFVSFCFFVFLCRLLHRRMAVFQYQGTLVSAALILVAACTICLFTKEFHAAALLSFSFFEWLNRHFVFYPVCDWICHGIVSTNLLLLFFSVSCALFAVRVLSVSATQSLRYCSSLQAAWGLSLAFVLTTILAAYNEHVTYIVSMFVLSLLEPHFDHFYGELCNGLSYSTIDGLPLFVLSFGGLSVFLFLKFANIGRISGRRESVIHLDIT